MLNKIPVKWRQKLSWLRQYLIFTPSNYRRWNNLAKAPLVKPDKAKIFYGYDKIATADVIESGGMVKFQSMLDHYPNTPDGFNILYIVSSRMPADWKQLLSIAKKRGALVLWNQNGVAYPAWHGSGWKRTNYPMKVMLREADYVFYQSQFCKETANKFVTERKGPSEILYNPVNTSHFKPGKANTDKPFILVGGTQQHFYKVALPMRALAQLQKKHPELRLRVMGKLTWKASAKKEIMALAKELDIENFVDFTGAYIQNDAPSLMQGAIALIHPKYNDPCPGLVIEAMACGIPIVYSKSGGVVELVPENAGVYKFVILNSGEGN